MVEHISHFETPVLIMSIYTVVFITGTSFKRNKVINFTSYLDVWEDGQPADIE